MYTVRRGNAEVNGNQYIYLTISNFKVHNIIIFTVFYDTFYFFSNIFQREILYFLHHMISI